MCVTMWCLRQEIVIVLGGEIVCCAGLAAKRLAILNLLKIVQAAGDTFIPICIKSVHIDGCTAVNTRVYLGAVKNRLAVHINDAGSGRAVGINKVTISIGCIIRTFQIAIAERCLDGGKGRNRLAVTLQFGFAFLIGCLDRKSVV